MQLCLEGRLFTDGSVEAGETLEMHIVRDRRQQMAEETPRGG